MWRGVPTTPRKSQKLHEQGWDSVVFHIEDYGPFAIGWSAFVKKEEIVAVENQ